MSIPTPYFLLCADVDVILHAALWTWYKLPCGGINALEVFCCYYYWWHLELNALTDYNRRLPKGKEWPQWKCLCYWRLCWHWQVPTAMHGTGLIPFFFFFFLQQLLLVLLHFCFKEVPPSMPSGNTTFLSIFFSHKQTLGDWVQTYKGTKSEVHSWSQFLLQYLFAWM